jgi:hypothetical protein
MGDTDSEGTQTTPAKLEPAATIPSGRVLSGTDKLFDGRSHVGVAIEVAASGNVSHLIVSDAMSITSGAPIFITAPVRIKGVNLKKFLDAKGLALPDAVAGLLSNLEIGCEAFYFSTQKKALSAEEAQKYIADMKLDANSTPKAADVIAGYEVEDGPLLMMFEVKVVGGLIKSLTGDESLGALFDINSVMLRVLRCPASKRDTLVEYVQSLPQG